MPEFTLNRTHNLLGHGYNIRFTKGEPTYVPPELVREALSIGAEAIGGVPDVLGAEDIPPEQLTAADREAMYFAVFDDLFKENDAAKFGGDGRPSMATLKAALTFETDKKERDTMLNLYHAAQERAE